MALDLAGILLYSVDAIIKIAREITEAVKTVRRNKEECEKIAQCVGSVSAILNGMYHSTPAPFWMRGALDDLVLSLQRALDLVRECQEKRKVHRLLGAGDMAKELRRVQDDITRKVTLGNFAANVQINNMLAANMQYAHPPPPPPPMPYVAPQPMPWLRPAPLQAAPSMADFCCPYNWRR